MNYGQLYDLRRLSIADELNIQVLLLRQPNHSRECLYVAATNYRFRLGDVFSWTTDDQDVYWNTLFRIVPLSRFRMEGVLP